MANTEQKQPASRDQPGVKRPAGFDDVYQREMREIRDLRKLRDPQYSDNSSKPEDPIPNLCALSFSGGGIRSATLNLGILQGLARLGLLHQIDYLSTVSGGGYIGSWLTSWIKRTPNDGAQASTNIIEDRLKRSTFEDPAKAEFRPIAYLRQFSNYLTPQVSVFSADTWVVGAIWGRNTFLNFAILLGILTAIIALARLIGAGVAAYSPAADLSPNWWIMPAVSLVLLAEATAFIGLNLKAIIERRRAGHSQESIQILIILPAAIAAALLSIWVYLYSPWFSRWFDKHGFWGSVGIPTGVVAILFVLVEATSSFRKCFNDQHKSSTGASAGLACLFVLNALAPAFVTAALSIGLALLMGHLNGLNRPWIAICFGPPAVLWVFSVGMILQIGLMGHDLPDACREWLGRLRAWLMIYSLAWLAFFVASVWGPLWIASVGAWSGWAGMGITGSWIAATIAGVMKGNSGDTSGKPGEPGKAAPNPISETITLIAPYAFIAGFVLAVAFGVHQLTTFAGEDANSLVAIRDDYWTRMQGIGAHVYLANWTDASIRDLDILLIVALAVALILSFRVDINDFSLHHFYKNRLVRCYLGASRSSRRPNLFTGFDLDDDLPLDQLCTTAPRKEKEDSIYDGPLHIVNTTLNLSAGSNLAWQERQGSSFAFTPLFTGYKPNPGLLAAEAEAKENGYRRTYDYAYTRKVPTTTGRKVLTTTGAVAKAGIALGTAVAISGAAASPNSGYHTSTPVAILLTLFDVRLGWWLGNPTNNSTYRSRGPAIGLLYLFRELFGLADDTSSYVNLSDGGHFDNMGIYELVRRKCRYIILGDGEQDEGFTFNGLANAIRKCRTDFGVEIDIHVRRVAPLDGFSVVHCAVGRIHYLNDPEPGYLLYLKSSVTGDEPRDILEYKARQPAFPHQSTGDQWFDESQFESYRRLGLHIVESAFGNVSVGAKSIKSMFDCLEEQWYPPTEVKDGVSSGHADTYAALMKRLCDDSELAYLDAQIFCRDGSHECGPASSPEEQSHEIERKAFFYCLDLIQLMENVWTDLHLFNKVDRDSPKNGGWIRIFQYWARQPIFQSTWKSAGYTFNPLFQQFFISCASSPPQGKPEPSCGPLPK